MLVLKILCSSVRRGNVLDDKCKHSSSAREESDYIVVDWCQKGLIASPKKDILTRHVFDVSNILLYYGSSVLLCAILVLLVS